MEQVAFRLEREVIERIDKQTERLDAQSPGVVHTRSDAVRVLLLRALDDVEREPPRKK